MASSKFLVPMGALVIKGSSTNCLLPGRQVEISAPGGLMRALLSKCDGRTSREDLLESLGRDWDRCNVELLLQALEGEGVLADANSLAGNLWGYVRNPPSMGTEPEAGVLPALLREAQEQVNPDGGAAYFLPPSLIFRELIEQRSSARGFGDATLPLEKIVAPLWAAYGVLRRGDGDPIRRTVPSAGGIYPLHLHYVNLRDTDGLAKGVYRVHFRSDQAVGFAALNGDAEGLFRCFTDPAVLAEAQGVIIVSGDWQRTAAKYRNRAMLYVPIEAGHVAQNILLCTTENGVASLEIGGILESRLAKLLELGEAVEPLVAIAIGTAKTLQVPSDCRDLGKAIEFSWIDLPDTAFKPALHIGRARICSPDGREDWAWGRAREPRLAYTKTIVEAFERMACTRPQNLLEAPPVDIAVPLLPQRLVVYRPAQYRRRNFPFSPLNPSAPYWWKEGRDYCNGDKVMVIADCVYFGGCFPTADAKPYTAATSSGVAAHFSLEQAIQAAALELVERDAFMMAWLRRMNMPDIDRADLPQALRERIRRLEEAGLRIAIKDFSLDLVPVIFVFGQSEVGGFTKVSCAAGFDAETALDHALQEVESALLLESANKGGSIIGPRSVATPEEHGLLYAQRRYYKSADFLAAKGHSVALSSIGNNRPADWPTFLDALAKKGLRLYWVDLSDPGYVVLGRPVHVARVFIPGLVPISFGYGQEPLGMPRLAADIFPAAACVGENPTVYTSFPHPFS